MKKCKNISQYCFIDIFNLYVKGKNKFASKGVINIGKKIIKSIYVIVAVLCTLALCAVSYLQTVLPDSYSIVSGNELSINSTLPLSVKYQGNAAAQSIASAKTGDKYTADIELLGLIPVKDANVTVVDEKQVNVLGQAFGVKLYTDGVLVIDLSSVDTKQGNVQPAKDAGLKIGDSITYIDGVKIESNADISYIIENSDGKTLDVTAVRDTKEIKLKLKPAYSETAGRYKGGIWVRDSSAGIGTLTFYNPSTNVMCGLGHGLCDSDADCLMSVGSGELVLAEIVAYTKSKKGSPGELKGRLTDTSIAQLEYNCNSGIYGVADHCELAENYMAVAMSYEVQTGDAQILTTINNQGPRYFDCKILSVNDKNSTEKNIVIKITDEELISVTGGIVQGMSGSPIVQNGKLVGAVTHVLVDDTTKGYAIFAENMLETAQSVPENNKLKDAS